MFYDIAWWSALLTTTYLEEKAPGKLGVGPFYMEPFTKPLLYGPGPFYIGVDPFTLAWTLLRACATSHQEYNFDTKTTSTQGKTLTHV